MILFKSNFPIPAGHATRLKSLQKRAIITRRWELGTFAQKRALKASDPHPRINLKISSSKKRILILSKSKSPLHFKVEFHPDEQNHCVTRLPSTLD